MAHAPSAGRHAPGHALHPHHFHRLVGRRVARWHGPDAIANRCFKTRLLGPKLTAIVSALTSPAVLTVAGMTALGAGAFGGARLLPTITGPQLVIPGGKPPHHHTLGPPTSVPEPGTAALLAVAMVVVLFGGWRQGGRALRGHPESIIASTPLRKRRVSSDTEDQEKVSPPVDCATRAR
jgi:hypothetical protein